MNATRRVLCSLSMLALLPVTGNALAQERWNWIVAPYLWGIDVSTDLNVAVPPGGIDRQTSFGDILDKFDGAFQIHIEGQGERFGVFTDFTYLGLSDEHSRQFFRSESDLDTRLFELAGVWNPGDDRFSGVDVFAGLRYIDLDITATITPTGPAGLEPIRVDVNETFNDFMLGARYTWAFDDRWGLTLRGDGSWGDTEGTWNASVVANYKMKSGSWFFGYRYLDVEVETRGVATNLVVKGPEVGYGFNF